MIEYNFLARRWSGRRVSVSAGGNGPPSSRAGAIRVPAEGSYPGTAGDRRRQARAVLWQESVRQRHCAEFQGGEHAFGFILNAMEAKRSEALGLRAWRGMAGEAAFARAWERACRPGVSSFYGRARMVEAFYQALRFGSVAGAVQPSHLEKAQKAARAAQAAVDEALEKDLGTGYVKSRVPQIVKILGIDPLLSVPSVPLVTRKGMALDERDLRRELERDGIEDPGRAGEIMRSGPSGSRAEQETGGDGEVSEGIEVPGPGGDGELIYDADLVGRLKSRFRRLRFGWREAQGSSGDEFDGDGYIDGSGAFLSDSRTAVKSNVMVLLDHSSSIADWQSDYKKATLALCELLAYVRARFSVYAFGARGRDVVCWLVKPDGARWGRPHADRLARIAAAGSTPLAEVYGRMMPALQSARPDVLLTLTDGEPSDAAAARSAIAAIRRLGVRAAAVGLGPDTVRATSIAVNLGRLGYERTVAVSRLQELPGRVISLLDR